MANDPRNPSGPGAPAPDFLAGLDAFSRKIDEEQKAYEHAEVERRRTLSAPRTSSRNL